MSVRSIEAEVSIKSGVQAECTIGREVIVEVHDDVNLESLEVTTNGSYRPTQGVDGWDRVTVEVPERQPVTEHLSVTANGQYTHADGVDGFSDVSVQVPEHIPVTESLSVTENGTYEPSVGVDGYDRVSVSVPERVPVTESLTATTNGVYEPDSGVDGYDHVTVAVPERVPDIESLTVTSNGTYTSTKDGYNPVTVNVPERQPITESLSVTENGTYTPPAGIDGYSPITVNVPQGSTPTGTKQISITENGTTIADVSAYANAEITVNVPTGVGGGYDDFSGGNLQAIISHGQEYILTDYSGSMQGVFASKFADTNKTSYEGYWSMAYNGIVVGIQRNSNKDNLNIKIGTSSCAGVAYPGYDEGEPITVIVATQSTTNVANHPLVIFGSYYNGNLENTKGTFAFYGLNVFDSNGDLVKKFVPWLNNGVACVKDLVSGTIYANSGTGAFDYIDYEGVTHTA